MSVEHVQAEERVSIGSLVGRLAQRLTDRTFPTGEHAALRRLRTDGPDLRHAVALYRLMELAGISTSDPDGVRRWAAIINALALCRGEHRPDRRAGAVLYAANFSEARLADFIEAYLIAPTVIKLRRTS
jgi:CRISPR system Cascade subunit CasB